jgi:nitroreductase
MKRLGEILLDRGAIAIAELHTGLEACHYSGGRLGTQLLKFGFVDEHALLEALSEQLGVPSVSSTILRRAPDSLRRLIPLHVARRLQVVVFEKKDGDLSVAMTTPRSPSAIEEVVSYIGLDIKPHVASEIGILTALAEIKEEEAPEVSQPPGTGYVPATDEWQRLWTPPKLRSSDVLRARPPRPAANSPVASTYPGLTPVPESSRPASVGPLDKDLYRQLLRQVEHRDEVGDLLLRRATAILERCYLLAVHSGKMVGWLGKGVGVVVDDVQSFTAPQSAPSGLSGVDSQEGFWGPMGAGEVDDALQQILGEPPPKEVFICPLLVKNRVVAYLVGDSPGSPVTQPERQQLVSAAQKAGVAFEMLIMKKKILA